MKFIICFFVIIDMLLVVSMQWDIGYYLHNNSWLQWESSCKTWSDGASCDTCEDYMFLNFDTSLWDFWDEGTYHDKNTAQCRSWEGSWLENWGYQSTCFECPEGQVFDTETFEWVSTWENQKSIIMGSIYAIPRIWRNKEIYVNSQSTSLIELGTRNHPYRSIKSAFSEIFNHYSNRDNSVIIYLAEGQRYYMEDATNYILNITNVTITSYSESLSASGRATIIPTKIPQPNRSKKAAFSLLVYTDLNFDEVIHEGVYSESENTNLETI